MKKSLYLSIIGAAISLCSCGSSMPSDEMDRMVGVYQSATQQVEGAMSVDEVSAIAQDVRNELSLITSEHKPSGSQEATLQRLDADFNAACEKKVERLQSVPEPDGDDGDEVIIED